MARRHGPSRPGWLPLVGHPGGVEVERLAVGVDPGLVPPVGGMEEIPGQSVPGRHEMGDDVGDAVAAGAGGTTEGSVDVAAGRALGGRRQRGHHGGLGEFLDHGGDPRRDRVGERVAHHVVGADGTGDEHRSLLEVPDQVELVGPHVVAPGAAAADVDHPDGSTVGLQRAGDPGHPGAGQAGRADPLGDGVAQDDPQRQAATQRRCSDQMPLPFEDVRRPDHLPGTAADAGEGPGEGPGPPLRSPQDLGDQGVVGRLGSGVRGHSLRIVVLVDLDAVSMSRPNRPLFSDVSVTVSRGDRLGVVGINGTGKSTLLSVIAGARRPETGEVRRGRGVTVASLDQVTRLDGGTVRDAVGAGWRGEAVLDRLGLGSLLDRGLDELSGGQEKRVALARALVAEADLLVLDEPTNHLDVDAIEWLERELASFKGGLVLVTHDRWVLDRVTTRILELDQGRAFAHDGGYPGYLRGRAGRELRAAAAEATRRNLARHELEWLRRGAKARTRKSRARIDRAEALLAGGPEPDARDGDLDFGALHGATPRLGDQVVELHDVTVGFVDQPPLITGLDLLLGRRERLGVAGVNGSGKSTLLEVICGRREPLAGRRVVGPTAEIALHDQRGRDLPEDARVRNLVAGEGAEPDWWDLSLLERFWFDTDAQHAPVELLSGGERRRLQLVLTLASRPNVLLLDEPTNDLDLETLDLLQELLGEYAGTVILVSHDRDFLDRVVTSVLAPDGDGVWSEYAGGYSDMIAQRKGEEPTKAAAVAAGSSATRVEAAGVETAKAASAPTAKGAAAPSGQGKQKLSYKEKFALESIPKRIEELAARIAGLEEKLAAPSLFTQDPDAFAKASEGLAAAQGERAALEDEWLALEMKRETMEGG